MCSQHTSQGISNLHRHRPLRVPIHTFVEWFLVDPFCLPREMHIRQVYDSNQGPVDLQLLDQHATKREEGK